MGLEDQTALDHGLCLWLHVCVPAHPLPEPSRLTSHSTPLGQAIGLATSSLYSPDSEVGLILVGVMNAISAGLLTYASLVELLSEDFLSDESWRILRGKRRVFACLLVFFGAFFMSLVGAWA